MTNPFEDADRAYLVLVNHRGQHSLWPADIAVPAGWTVTHGPASRTQCLEHLESTWTDIKPVSAAR